MRWERDGDLGVGVREANAVRGQTIQIGRFGFRIPIAADVVGPHGIQRNQKHRRPTRSSSRRICISASAGWPPALNAAWT